jgi:hypothetical protein
MRIRIHNTTQDLNTGADGELRLGGHDAPEDQRSAGGLGRAGGRNIRHSVQGILNNGGNQCCGRGALNISFNSVSAEPKNLNYRSGSRKHIFNWKNICFYFVISTKKEIQRITGVYFSVLHDIFMRIQFRIRGSMPLTNGSGSCYFHH